MALENTRARVPPVDSIFTSESKIVAGVTVSSFLFLYIYYVSYMFRADCRTHQSDFI